MCQEQAVPTNKKPNVCNHQNELLLRKYVPNPTAYTPQQTHVLSVTLRTEAIHAQHQA